MKFTVLGSGSTGNSVLIATEKTQVLVDAGMSAKQILERVAAVNEDSAKLDAILITHEHGDHAGGLRVLRIASSFAESSLTDATRSKICFALIPASTKTRVFSVAIRTELPVEPLPRTVNFICLI